jgi:hypothetical protein
VALVLPGLLVLAMVGVSVIVLVKKLGERGLTVQQLPHR